MTSAPLAARLSVPSGPLFFPVTAYGPDGSARPRRLPRARAPGRRGRRRGRLRVLRHRGVPRARRPRSSRTCVRRGRRGDRRAGCRSSRAPATAPRSPCATRGSPRRPGPTGCSPCRRISSSPARRACCGTTGSWPPPPPWTSSSTSATTPSSPRETVVELARTEGIIGLKDGLGDLDLMQRIVSAVRTEVPGDFLYFNGLPTAELTGLAYRGLGVTLYSSAVFCFAPEIALAFHRALDTGDDATVEPAPRRLLPALRRTARAGPRIRRLPGQGRGPAARPRRRARSGRRCTSRPRTMSSSSPQLIERGLRAAGGGQVSE